MGEALIMTAFGLAVAVPAVLGYNWLVRRNKVAMESVRGFGADLHGILMGSRSAPQRSRALDRPTSKEFAMAMNIGSRRRRRRRGGLDHQHDAARGRDAGAADHLPDHHSGGHAERQRQAAEETNVPRQTKPENVEIAVTKDGDVYWGLQLVGDNDVLVERLKKVSCTSRSPKCTFAATWTVATSRSGESCLRPACRHSEDRLRDRAAGEDGS